MLKKFFISMLGTLAGIWISIILLVIGSLFTIGILVGKSMKDTSSVGAGRILHITLEGSIPERMQPGSVIDMLTSAADDAQCGLDDILGSVRAAAKDKDVEGIYLDCRGASMGFASRQELMEALKTFRQSGKWIYAYADNFSQGDYITASVADKIYLNPVGMMDFYGLQSMTMFYKNVLDKLGVEVQIIKVGSFKSAVEPFIRMDMSDPSRMQTQVFLNQIWDNLASDVAGNRGFSQNDFNQWADSLPVTWAPEIYVDRKLVSELRYRTEVEDLMRKQMDIDDKDDLPFVTPAEYMMAKGVEKIGSTDKDHIAVLYAVGDIVDSGDGGIVAQDMVPQIRKLALDKHVKGLVLRVNSGGGSAFASEQIWKALEDFKKTEKPFYVSMGDYAASGGYYISCGADSIFADAATLTGSIGIFGMLPSASKLIEDKIGLGIQYVETNPGANMRVPFEPLTERQLAAMQDYVERGYDLFTNRVAEGRGIPQDSVKTIGEGRVWDGMTAAEIGLVDKLATLDYAVNSIAAKVGLKATDVVGYPELQSDIWATILAQSKNLSVGLEGIPAEQLMQYMQVARTIGSLSPVQARMEPIVIK